MENGEDEVEGGRRSIAMADTVFVLSPRSNGPRFLQAADLKQWAMTPLDHVLVVEKVF